MIALSKHSKRLLGIRLVPYPGVDASKTVSRLPAVNASHVISLTAQVLFKSCPSTATLTRQPEIGTLHVGAVPFHYVLLLLGTKVGCPTCGLRRTTWRETEACLGMPRGKPAGRQRRVSCVPGGGSLARQVRSKQFVQSPFTGPGPALWSPRRLGYLLLRGGCRAARMTMTGRWLGPPSGTKQQRRMMDGGLK